MTRITPALGYPIRGRPTCTCIPARGQTSVADWEHEGDCPMKRERDRDDALKEDERRGK